MSAITTNPILGRELKERMRSRGAWFAITVYLAFLSIVVVIAERSAAEGPGFSVTAAVAGRQVFHFLLFGLLFMVCLMVPSFGAGAVSMERERQTFHLVQVTLLRPWQIVLGKVTASCAYLMFLILITLPFLSVSFVLGGVTPLDVLRAYAMVMLTGAMFTVLSVAISSRARSTRTATLLCYVLVFALTAGTPSAYGLVKMARAERERHAAVTGAQLKEPTWTLVLNPFLGTASAIQGRQSGGANSPFSAMFSFLTHTSTSGYATAGVISSSGSARYAVTHGPNGRRVMPLYTTRRTPQSGTQLVPLQSAALPSARRSERLIPFWVWTVFWYLVLSAVGFAFAVRNVRAPAGRVRLPKQRRRAVASET